MHLKSTPGVGRAEVWESGPLGQQVLQDKGERKGPSPLLCSAHTA